MGEPGGLPSMAVYYTILTVLYIYMYIWASLVAQTVKASACNAGDPSSIPGSGRTPGEGNGNPLQ